MYNALETAMEGASPVICDLSQERRAQQFLNRGQNRSRRCYSGAVAAQHP